MSVGRWRVDRQFEKTPEKHHGLDVKRDGPTPTCSPPFAATTRRPARCPRRRRPAPRPRNATGAVATAEREAPTETIPTGGHEAATETIPTAADDAKTEVIRTDIDPKHAKPGSEPE